MIYSRFGCELEIKRKINDEMVECLRLDDKKVKNYYLPELKADNGLQEINEAIAKLKVA